MEKWKVDVLNIENAGTITESDRSEIIIHAANSVDATFKNLCNRYNVSRYHEGIKSLFYRMLQPYVLFHGNLNLDDRERKRIYNKLALHNKVRLFEILEELQKLPDYIFRNHDKQDVEKIILWIKKSIETFCKSCHILKDGRMYTQNMYLSEIENWLQKLEIEYIPEKIKLQQDLRSNRTKLKSAEKEITSFEELADIIKEIPTDQQILDENLKSVEGLRDWIIKNIRSNRKADLEKLKNLKDDLSEWQLLVTEIKGKRPLYEDRLLQEKHKERIIHFETVIKAALSVLDGRIQRKEDAEKSNNLPVKTLHYGLTTNYSAEQLKILHKELIDKKYIAEINVNDFIYLLSGKPLIKGMPIIKWIKPNTRKWLAYLLAGNIEKKIGICVNFNFSTANKCFKVTGRKLDSNDRPKVGYREIDDILKLCDP